MTVKELRDLLSGLPDTAEVYVESDHGQEAEKADSVAVADDAGELPFYGADLDWDTPQRVTPGMVTAVLIS